MRGSDLEIFLVSLAKAIKLYKIKLFQSKKDKLMAKCIMVVDDEEIILEISKRKLIESGYEVMTAGDGAAALDMLKKKTPDLILLDVQMPNMNGYTFVMEKDKTPEFAKIPVVVLTAYGEMEPVFKRHGIKSYLLKPLKLQEIVEKVQEILGA